MYEGQDVVEATRVHVYADDANERQVKQTLERLRDRFGAAVDPELLEGRVRAFFAAFEGAPVREFVPVLVEREVRRELGRHPEGS